MVKTYLKTFRLVYYTSVNISTDEQLTQQGDAIKSWQEAVDEWKGVWCDNPDAHRHPQ